MTIFSITFILNINSAFAVGTDSSYQQLIGDMKINSTSVVINSVVNISSPGYILVQSDGRAFPNGAAIASMYITVNGEKISNASVIDWSDSSDPQQHSFNSIGTIYISIPGQYTVCLIAQSLNSVPFTVGASSGLAVISRPATSIQQAYLGQDTGPLSFNVSGIKKGTALPHTPLISIALPSTGGIPAIALASGRIYVYGHYGDPLTAIYSNNFEPPNNVGNWSDNDMWSAAENQAPFFNHMYLPAPSSATTVAWNGTALPYCEDQTSTNCSSGVDQVRYKVGGDSTLITLSGGMNVVGGYSTSTSQNNRTNYVNTGTGNWGPVTILSTQISVPEGHNGIIFFTGKTRVQGGPNDAGGTVTLQLNIDGVNYGNISVQQLKTPDSVSTRTMGVSYLSINNRLAPGIHTVKLIGQSVGSFVDLALTNDLPLVWFD